MPRHRPLLFTVRHSEKPFRGRHWYVSGFKGEKRIQLWFRSEKEAKAAAAGFTGRTAVRFSSVFTATCFPQREIVYGGFLRILDDRAMRER